MYSYKNFTAAVFQRYRNPKDPISAAAADDDASRAGKHE